MRMYTTIRTDTIERKIANYELYGNHDAADALRDLGVPVRDWKIALEVYQLAQAAIKLGYTVTDSTLIRYRVTAIQLMTEVIKLKKSSFGYTLKSIDDILTRFEIHRVGNQWHVFKGYDHNPPIYKASTLKEARAAIAQAIVER
jgi:hypothetical protein